ncbi:hypothetical protein TNCV_3209891 [Trichonephila clavipes]|nr:hypothetical protein TNCV_3209891 [Trichonephila clavipes]
MRRDEGHVVDSPLVYKKGFFSGYERKDPCPLDRDNLRGDPWMRTGGEPQRKDDQYWSEREGKTMNVGGIGE